MGAKYAPKHTRLFGQERSFGSKACLCETWLFSKGKSDGWHLRTGAFIRREIVNSILQN